MATSIHDKDEKPLVHVLELFKIDKNLNRFLLALLAEEIKAERY